MKQRSNAHIFQQSHKNVSQSTMGHRVLSMFNPKLAHDRAVPQEQERSKKVTERRSRLSDVLSGQHGLEEVRGETVHVLLQLCHEKS